MMVSVEKAYEAGTLDKVVHERLVADLDNVAADAAITPAYILTPLSVTVGKSEIDYVRRFRAHKNMGVAGLALVGRDPQRPVETTMAAIAGALLRNFIRAKVLTVSQLIEHVQEEGAVGVSCILVPNFFIEESHGGSLPKWKVSMLLDILLQRHAQGLQTVLYISDMAAMASEYGTMLRTHVEAHYTILNA